MNEILEPLESEHKQLVDELPTLEQLSDDLAVQASKIDEIEKAAADALENLNRLMRR